MGKPFEPMVLCIKKRRSENVGGYVSVSQNFGHWGEYEDYHLHRSVLSREVLVFTSPEQLWGVPALMRKVLAKYREISTSCIAFLVPRHDAPTMSGKIYKFL